MDKYLNTFIFYNLTCSVYTVKDYINIVLDMYIYSTTIKIMHKRITKKVARKLKLKDNYKNI